MVHGCKKITLTIKYISFIFINLYHHSISVSVFYVYLRILMRNKQKYDYGK